MQAILPNYCHKISYFAVFANYFNTTGMLNMSIKAIQLADIAILKKKWIPLNVYLWNLDGG